MTDATSSPASSHRTIEDWIVDAYAAVETQLEQEQQDQRRLPTVLGRYGSLLRLLGALQIGLLVASGCIFLLFVILNLLFHMQP
jgi:hypothetical protein